MTIGSYPLGAFPAAAAAPQLPPPWGSGPPLPLSSNRRRLASWVMRTFDPIEAGEVDNFGFDFTADVADEDIESVQWSCRLTPYSGGVDPDPGSRAPGLLQPPQHVVPYSVADGSVQFRSGFFAVAPVGPMPASAVGATYEVQATAYLTGGQRQIILSATLPCVLAGR